MRLVLLVLLLCIESGDPCPIADLKDVVEVGCRIKEESHGWKLWLSLKYRDKREWTVIEKPADSEFWKTADEAFARCQEWRQCVNKKILAAHKK